MSQASKIKDLFRLDKPLNKWICQIKVGEEMCNAQISCNGNTSGRNFHVQKKHSEIFRALTNDDKPVTESLKVGNTILPYHPDSTRVMKLNRAVLDFIIATNQPISVVRFQF